MTGDVVGDVDAVGVDGRGSAEVRAYGAVAIVAGPAGVLTFLTVGGLFGVVAGVLVASGLIVVIRRRESPDARRRREQLTADLPFLADLVVACLRAGQPLSGAVDTASRAVGGPLGARLSWIAAQMRLGADPASAWLLLADEKPLATFARTMSRAMESGAPVADVLTRLAEDARHAHRATSSATARKAGVHAVAPLGLCFLPAFVFLGIIPVVAGLATQVLMP
ncbi:type II secretion system F family protein [Acrocarpospora catenulata]|uniref:type II secretion system F family protein n=1 Tax=Acrocarpospora catenulata TaxID=2836182 RepID=UPI002023B98C|nr:type II secretion system F family protein [Acrocarpospora catenulata]